MRIVCERNLPKNPEPFKTRRQALDDCQRRQAEAMRGARTQQERTQIYREFAAERASISKAYKW